MKGYVDPKRKALEKIFLTASFGMKGREHSTHGFF
jgi:hypothetical protein